MNEKKTGQFPAEFTLVEGWHSGFLLFDFYSGLRTSEGVSQSVEQEAPDSSILHLSLSLAVDLP